MGAKLIHLMHIFNVDHQGAIRVFMNMILAVQPSALIPQLGKLTRCTMAQTLNQRTGTSIGKAFEAERK